MVGGAPISLHHFFFGVNKRATNIGHQLFNFAQQVKLIFT